MPQTGARNLTTSSLPIYPWLHAVGIAGSCPFALRAFMGTLKMLSIKEFASDPQQVFMMAKHLEVKAGVSTGQAGLI